MALFVLIPVLAASIAPAQQAGETPGNGVAGRALSQVGDADRGRRIFNRCRACHQLAGDRQAMGPTLENLFGRTAGSLATYDRYSRALLDADFVWTEEKLDEWLANPNSFLPGNKMTFAGISDPGDRRDLMAYLRRVTEPEPQETAE